MEEREPERERELELEREREREREPEPELELVLELEREPERERELEREPELELERERGHMSRLPRCPKCNGLQISERLREETLTILQIHCINCGRIEEPGLVPHSKIYNGYATYGKAQWQTNESEE